MKSGYLPVMEIDGIPAGAACVAILNALFSAIRVLRDLLSQVSPVEERSIAKVVEENLMKGPVGFLYHIEPVGVESRYKSVPF